LPRPIDARAQRLYKELDSDDLGATYYTANIDTVEVQLQRAGVRLAAMLNAMYAHAPATQPTTAPATQPIPTGGR